MMRLGELATWLLSPSEATVVIAARRADVYAVIEDPDTYPDWLAGAQAIRSVDDAFPAKGAEFHHEVGPAEAITVADDTISKGANAPEELGLRVNAGPFTADVQFLLHEVGGGTEVRLRERAVGAWSPLMPVLRTVLYIRNKASLARLKSSFAVPVP
jgi:uncharacterized protein YndB with AHSA1/START domain